jgi:hypothetical protein
MFDAEVMRLRRLRRTALRARALAESLDSHATRADGVFAKSAAGCWRIARTISGRLRAHPHPRFQRGPSNAAGAFDGLRASWSGAVARYKGRSLQCCSAHLALVIRELDDVRAVAWSADFSENLGRSQAQLRRLIQEADAAAQREGGTQLDAPTQAKSRDCTDSSRAAAAANWPYLAI